MVGYTPSLSTAVWVGTEQGLPLRNPYGSPIYGSALPSDIWKDTMDGALDGTSNEAFPDPASIGGQAGVPAYTAPSTAPPSTTTTPAPSSETLPTLPPVVITPSQVEILPGVTIPVPGVVPQEPAPTPGAGGTGGTGGATDQDGGAVTTLEPLPNGGVPRPGTN